jgi:polyphosphate kinase
MPRNFHRRVEVMFPIEAPDLKRRVLKEILPTYLRDNTRTRILQADGKYYRPSPDGHTPHRSQEEFLTFRGDTPEEVAANRLQDNGEALNGSAAEHAAPQTSES